MPAEDAPQRPHVDRGPREQVEEVEPVGHLPHVGERRVAQHGARARVPPVEEPHDGRRRRQRVELVHRHPPHHLPRGGGGEQARRHDRPREARAPQPRRGAGHEGARRDVAVAHQQRREAADGERVHAAEGEGVRGGRRDRHHAHAAEERREDHHRDERAAQARPVDAGHEEGVEEVVLLLHRERPRDAEGDVLVAPEGHGEVGEVEEVPPQVGGGLEGVDVEAARAGDVARRGDEDEHGVVEREDAQRAARVEGVPEALGALRVEQDPRDEEAADGEEHVDPRPARVGEVRHRLRGPRAGVAPHMVEHHERDREGAQAVELDDRAVLSGGGHGGGRRGRDAPRSTGVHAGGEAPASPGAWLTRPPCSQDEPRAMRWSPLLRLCVAPPRRLRGPRRRRRRWSRPGGRARH